MTVYHHDSRDRAVAVSESAKLMRDKLWAKIESSKKTGQATIEKVLKEIPNDRFVRMEGAQFFEAQGRLKVGFGSDPLSIHPFALGKMCETTGIPRDFLNKLLTKVDEDENWGAELAVDLMNKHFHHVDGRHSRKMLRTVQTDVRGFLSDSYARLHPGRLLEAFAGACKESGLHPYGGYSGDTKFIVHAVLDRVIEPIKDEVIGIGVTFKESPYGDGATEVSVFMERMWCTNTAIQTSELRKVHLGARAPVDAEEADSLYQTATNASCKEIKRAITEQLDSGYLLQLEDGIKAAHAAKVSHSQFEGFLKKHLTKSDVEAVKEKYRSTDITELPAGDSWWRASNALSWYANQVKSPETQYDLQKLAGTALQMGAK